MLLYSLRYVYFPPDVPRLRTAFWLINGIGKRQPVWPFDLYPTFTPATPSDVQVWEARWVTSGGREMRASPSAYYNVFGKSGLTWNVTSDAMLRKGDPEQDQARSLNLVRLLWQRELPDIQRNVAAVNVYRVEYRLQAPSDRFPAAFVAQSILYTFPLQEITGNSIPFSALKRNDPRVRPPVISNGDAVYPGNAPSEGKYPLWTSTIKRSYAMPVS